MNTFLFKNFLRFALLVVLSLAGFFLIMLLTSKWGVGQPQVMYIFMAKCLSGLDSCRWDYTMGTFVWQHYPPLFPYFLAIIHWFGGPGPVDAARWLNATLFGINIFLVGFLIYRYTNAFWMTWAALLWMLVKIDNLYFYSEAMSEPLFMFLGLLWFVFLMNFLENKRSLFLWASAMSAALACLTRFAGVPFVLTGGIILLLENREGWPIGLKRAGVFSFAALLPMMTWMLVNVVITGHLTDRIIAFHPYLIADIKGCALLTNHLAVSISSVVLLIAGMMVAGWGIFKNRDAARVQGIPEIKIWFLGVLFIFSCLYLLSWGFVVGWMDGLAQSTRYFFPIEVFGLLFCLGSVHILFSVVREQNFLKFCFVFCLLIYLIAINVPGAFQWGMNRYHEGLFYDGKVWSQSAIIKEAQKISKTKLIYSNNVMALYSRLSLKAIPFPFKMDPLSFKPNSSYLKEMNRMKKDLSDLRGVVVYCSLMYQIPGQSTMEDIKKIIPLRNLVKVSDGEIDAWEKT
ncbi:MAG: hypothetical protein HQL13_00260 [Candidatus Omnitrophica bacterium]|nr:hypothetical protein [Candidatus Omnitrophota bacterium]